MVPERWGVLSWSAEILFLGFRLNRPLAGQDLGATGPAIFRAKSCLKPTDRLTDLTLCLDMSVYLQIYGYL